MYSSEDEEAKARAQKQAEERGIVEALLPADKPVEIQFTTNCDVSTMELCALCGCLGREEEVVDRLIWCKDCAECFHEFCLPHPIQLKSEALKTDWQCRACKNCTVCGGKEEGIEGSERRNSFGGKLSIMQREGANKEKRFAYCGKCDKGVHLACLLPPLEDIPEPGTWVCLHLCRFFCSYFSCLTDVPILYFSTE